MNAVGVLATGLFLKQLNIQKSGTVRIMVVSSAVTIGLVVGLWQVNCNSPMLAGDG